ncbi:hypothetical protein ACTFIY_010087 [Dictyostelium cf. discoideum]
MMNSIENNNQSKHIVVYRKIHQSLIEKLENQGYKVTQFEPINSNNILEFYEAIKTANGLIGSVFKIDENVLSKVPFLECVSAISVGYDNYDLAVLNDRKIPLMHTPNVLNDSMADIMMGLMVTVARKLAYCDKRMRNGEWNGPLDKSWFGIEVHHKKVGIIGMGRIGEVLAKRCRMGFDMEVAYYSRSRHLKVEELYDAKHQDLDTILSTSDFICVILPGSQETKHFFSFDQFSKMKNSAIFINAGRGMTVDEVALIDALETGKIAGAGLDVFEKEPLNKDSKLLTLENIVLLPHIGTSTIETQHIMSECAVNNLISALNGNLEKNCVNASIIKK